MDRKRNNKQYRGQGRKQNTLSKLNHNDHPRDNAFSCIIDSEHINIRDIQARIPSWKCINILSRPTCVDFIFCTGSGLYNPKLFNISAKLKPRMDSKRVLDKANLHETLMEKAPWTVARSYVVDSNTKYIDGELVILKSNCGAGGSGNYIVSNINEFNDAIEKLQLPTARSFEKDTREIRIVASEYIRSPLLYENRKFHLRVMIFVFIKHDGTKKCWMMNDAILAPAREEYIDTDYGNKMIHDTHICGNQLAELTTNLLGADLMINKVKELLTETMKHLLPGISKYKEAINGYDLYGADIMFTDTMDAKLLEINRTPDLAFSITETSKIINFRSLCLDSIMGTVFKEVFPYHGPSANVTLLL